MSHRLHSLRILSETDPDGGVWRSLYEPRTGVLLESEDPLRQKTRYEWETPFGPKKVTGSGGDERYFEWDKRGNLVSHTDCSGNVSRHAYDENGHPAGETDAEGRIEWSADYSAWGERQHSLPLAPEEAAASGTDCALRFQGQYFDAETGLHYNTFRYYDPGCGRFISPDPINIQGGLNLYQYAPNAANWIDPWGWINLNTNTATGNFGVYEICINGELHKFGKADLNRKEVAAHENLFFSILC